MRASGRSVAKLRVPLRTLLLPSSGSGPGIVLLGRAGQGWDGPCLEFVLGCPWLSLAVFMLSFRRTCVVLFSSPFEPCLAAPESLLGGPWMPLAIIALSFGRICVVLLSSSWLFVAVLVLSFGQVGMGGGTGPGVSLAVLSYVVPPTDPPLAPSFARAAHMLNMT